MYNTELWIWNDKQLSPWNTVVLKELVLFHAHRYEHIHAHSFSDVQFVYRVDTFGIYQT